MHQSESCKSLLIPKLNPGDVEKVARAVAFKVKHYIETKRTTTINISELSLASGLTGICMLIGELDAIYPEEEWDLLGFESLKMIQDLINKHGVDSLSLWNGISGVGLAAYTLSRKCTRYSSFISKINNVLSDNLYEAINRYKNNTKSGVYISDYDVVLGLTGVGRYLLLFADDRNINRHIKKILEYFITLSKKKLILEELVPCWYISSENHTEESIRVYPQGFFDVGLAHGISGVLAFLSISIKQGIEIPGQNAAIEEIAKWLISIKSEDNYGPIWPSKIGFNHIYGSSKKLKVSSYEAWCYGSPGIARALWLAGESLNNEEFKKVAIDTFLGCYKRPKSEWNILSSTFCHGYAGFLSLTQSMYKDTKLEEIGNLKDQLINDICDQYSEENIFGYYDYDKVKSVNVHDPGLLTGASGVALSLLSSVKEKKTNWDSAFLIN